MEQEQLVPLNEVCLYHEVEFSFVQSLEEVGLITIKLVSEAPFIALKQVRSLEQLIRLHQDLDINPEGLYAIRHILDQVVSLQAEVRQLRQRLDFYEHGSR
jgi:chaperone modulatory protein CbpM